MSPSNLIPRSPHFRLAPGETGQLIVVGAICLEAGDPHTIQSENVVLVITICTHECAHVLHHPEYWHIHFFEQINASYGISKSEILWCRYDNSTCPNIINSSQ